MMSNSHQRRPGIRPATRVAAAFAVGERVRIVNAPVSYGYNGRAGIVVAIAGGQISVLVDEPPSDMRCTTFYTEELEREAALNAEETFP
jgi:ribosomal protein L21E